MADFPSFQQSLGCFSLPAAKAQARTAAPAPTLRHSPPQRTFYVHPHSAAPRRPQLHAMPVYRSYLDAVTNATECQLAWDGFECFTACQRAAKRVLLEVHPDKFAHSFGCLRADHSRFGIAHALTLSFRGEANTACHARF